MSALVERVARAIAADDSGPEGSRLFEIHWREFEHAYLKSARAAIKAIEPEIQKLIGGLADIAHADDMTHAGRRHKAGRLYAEVMPIFEEALE